MISRNIKAYSRPDVLLGFAILITLVAYAASLTKQTFKQAEEAYNKNKIFEVEEALKKMIKNEEDLLKTFPECSSWCEVDESIRLKMIDSNVEPPSPILPTLPQTSRNKNFRMKISGEAVYVIEGNSSTDITKCWIIDSDPSKSNTSLEQPSQCSSS